MRKLMPPFLVIFTLILTACTTTSKPIRLTESELDHKSYAIAYSVTAQTYKDRVTRNYNVNAFINGVNDLYYNRVDKPIEQIQAMMLNRVVDHKDYAYYSGIMFADAFHQNVNYLDKNCWALLHKASMAQGMDDAMRDLQKGKAKAEDDPYLSEGADKVIQLCVKTIAYDENKSEAIKKVGKKKKTVRKKAVKK